MSQDVVVVGAGYSGVSAITTLERESSDIDLTWISTDAYHEVKHEIHRVIRTPSLSDGLAIPIDEIIGAGTTFRQGRVVAIHPDERTIDLADDEQISYDYLLVTVGARTAFYGIPGLEEHALLLERIHDAKEIHNAINGTNAPSIVVGGGGLSGVQTAGEIIEMHPNADVTVIEAMDTILPRAPETLQSVVGDRLVARGVTIEAGSPIVEATASEVVLDGEATVPYDILIWTGGITGQDVSHDGELELQRKRMSVDRSLQTNDAHVFACGDAAVIPQSNGVAPASAQAAWQAGPVAARNLLSKIRGDPLDTFEYTDKGTLVSIGDEAFAHDIVGIPITTFGSVPAATLKKLVAARWIADASSYRRALSLWSSL